MENVQVQQDHLVRRKPVPIRAGTSTSTYSRVEIDDIELINSRDSPIHGAHGRSWKPFWLRRTVLFAFTTVFAALVIALEILSVVSIKKDGIVSTSMKLYYLWTYGPTALLTVLSALWNRVDYRVRHMLPWILMQNDKFLDAKDSMVLDYLSPTRPEIIWHSLRKKHSIVALGSLVGVFHMTLIVLSTGLFLLVPNLQTFTNATYVTTTDFNFSSDAFAEINDYAWPVRAVPGALYNAVVGLNSPYPNGTTSQSVYQLFSSYDPNVSDADIQQVRVNILNLDLLCEPAQLSIDGWTATWNVSCGKKVYPGNPPIFDAASVLLNSSDCRINPGLPWIAYGNDGDTSDFAYIDTQGCDGATDKISNDNERLILGIGRSQQSGSAGPPPDFNYCSSPDDVARFQLLQSKNWICKVVLEAARADVTVNKTTLAQGTQPTMQMVPASNRSLLANVSGTALDNFNIDVISLANDEWVFQTQFPVAKTVSGRNQICAKALATGQNVTYHNLMNTDMFLDLTRRYFIGSGIQLLNQKYAVPKTSSEQGSILRYDERLVVQAPILRAMQGVLGAMVIGSLGLVMTLPRGNTYQQDPATLQGLMRILIISPPVTSILGGLGDCSLKRLKNHCLVQTFRAQKAEGSDIAIQTSRKDDTDTPDDQGIATEAQEVAASPIKWWRPIVVRKAIRMPVTVTVIAVAVTLEILLMISNRHHGILDVPTKPHIQLAWTIVPAVLMVCIKLYFEAFQTALRTFTPYRNLRIGMSSRVTIAANFLSQTGIESLFSAIKHKQVGVLFMTITALGAALLTIVTSGVFSAERVSFEQTSSVGLTSWFKTPEDGGSYLTNAENDATVSGLILLANLSFPAWTFKDLVLPSLQQTQTPQNNKQQSGQTLQSLEMTLPALRPVFNCSLFFEHDLPSLHYRITGGNPDNQEWSAGVYSFAPGPAECQGPKTRWLSQNQDASSPPYNYYSVYDRRSHDDSNYDKGVIPDTCSTLLFFWGRQDSLSLGQTNQTYSPVTYARGLSCYERIEFVNVSVTFAMPDFRILDTIPPVVREESSTLFTTNLLELPLVYMPRYDDSSDVNVFWKSTMQYYGITTSDLGNPAKDSYIAECLQAALGIVRAQQYNAVLRTPINDSTAFSDQQDNAYAAYSSTAQRISAASVSDRYRLIQHAVSTHILTGLLLLMVVCAALSSWTMSVAYLLPKNPSSIASMATLIADPILL